MGRTDTGLGTGDLCLGLGYGIGPGTIVHGIDQGLTGIKDGLADGLCHLWAEGLDLDSHDTGVRVKGRHYGPAPVAQYLVLSRVARQTVPDVMAAIRVVVPYMQLAIHLVDHVHGLDVVLDDVGIAQGRGVGTEKSGQHVQGLLLVLAAYGKLCFGQIDVRGEEGQIKENHQSGQQHTGQEQAKRQALRPKEASYVCGIGGKTVELGTGSLRQQRQ